MVFFKKRSLLLKITAIFVVSVMLFGYQNCAKPLSSQQASSLDQASIVPLHTEPPIISNISAPDLITKLNMAAISFRATAQGTASISTIKCSLDEAEPVDCMQGFSTANLSEGRHRLQIIATDSFGLASSPTFVEWTVDSVLPAISFNPAPTAFVASRSLNISFSALDGGSGIDTVVCTLDDVVVGCLNGSIVLTNLAEGNKSLRITATDRAQNVFSLTRSFIIDTKLPTVAFNMAPPAVVATTSLNITFSALDNGSGIDTVVCSLNNVVVSCLNGSLALSNLTEGIKSLRITATDRAQNVFNLNQNFEVRFNVPSIALTANPPAFDRAVVSSFSFTGQVVGRVLSTFECSRDNVLYLACNAGTISYNNLAEGNQSFYVRSVDVTTGARSAPLSYNWVIDRTLPVIAFSVTPAAMSTSASASFTFAITELNPNVRVCNLDNVDQATCNSPVSFTNLSNASHSFRVSATDRAGNTSQATFNWVVNTIVSKTLAWDPSLDANNVMDITVTGYRVYSATVPGMYGAPINVAAGAAPTSVLSLERGRTYYLAVTAVNAAGSESDRSMVLSYLVP
ncbi:MAG: hypothetical protein AABY53_01895 [Bdellovibrionota bacterium]